MKKKMIALTLAALTAVSMVGCGTGGEASNGEVPADTSAEAPENTADASGTTDFSGQEIVVGVWGGSWQEAFIEACQKPFEEATGATVILEEMGDNIVAQTLAQVQQDIDGIDIAAGIGAADFAMYLGGKGAVKELDYSRLPNSAAIDEGCKLKYGVGQYICADMFCYDNAAFPEIPQGAAGFWDTEKYPGDRALIGFSAAGVLEKALIADGVSFDEMYPIDLDRAFKKLDELKPSITKFWSSGSEIRQTISDKEAVAGSYWIAHANKAITEDGQDITITTQDTAMFADSFAIVANTKKEDLAYAFIDYCLSAESQAAFSSSVGYPPTNPDALALLPEEKQAQFAPMYQPYEEGGCFWADMNYWGENFEEANTRYMEWIAQ